ncbi:hypothetical protein NADFUDRAFT_81377 [Nadsonia fulvescens var. elongata DSM 6958]|uniref:DDHD domain-containing protein n=1 Tax=Nadsonia fulvescens var. elongata DSM 6958 TaxID=857566 RepID=A0A1E3PSI6_9ASCO|nr:hypothetical protein NADFUDRAFT_81377 [Nadsonia fulvescens var. elongata DSM 6958]
MVPVYWDPVGDLANVHSSTWFYSQTLGPVEPSLEDAVERAFFSIKPWTETYISELKSIVEIPEAMDKIRPLIEYEVFDGTKVQKVKARIEFSPCLQPKYTSIPKVYIFIQSSFSIMNTTSPAQVATNLLNEKIPSGAYATLQRHFSWDAWKDLKGLPQSVIDNKDKGPAKFDHLILVIHGIGQKISERVESLKFTYEVNKLHLMVSQQLDSSKVTQYSALPNSKVLTLPINWRRKLDFEQLANTTQSQGPSSNPYTLKEITMTSVPAVRNIITDVMLDIPYYMSHHKEKLLKAVIKETNRIFKLFCKYNPEFLANKASTVNLMGHSLGSIIALDILSSQPSKIEVNSELNFQKQVIDEILCFNTTNLFLLGSPAGFFLLLNSAKLEPRQADENETKHHKCSLYGCLAVKNIYNVINYSDPIAYLMNPTVDAVYASKIALAEVPGEKAFPILSEKQERRNSGLYNLENLVNGIKSSIPFLNTSSSPITRTGSPANDVENIKSYNVESTLDSGSFEKKKNGFLEIPTVSVASTGLPTVATSMASIMTTSLKTNPSSPVRDGLVDFPPMSHSSPNNTCFSPSIPLSSSFCDPPSSPLPNQIFDLEGEETDIGLSHLPEEVEMESMDFKREAEAEEKMFQLNENGQIDWVLPLNGTLENQYVSMLKAHTGYWESKDLARFIAIECVRKRGIENTLPQFRASKKSIM